MLPPGTNFPQVKLPSSKGGVTDLGEALLKAPAVVGIVPVRDEAWLSAVADYAYGWLMERFLNVYLVVDSPPSESRLLAETFGLQIPLLSDNQGLLLPAQAGFYLVSPPGVIQKGFGLEAGLQALDRLV